MPPEIGKLIGIVNAEKPVHRLIHSFPKLRLQVEGQPITCSLLSTGLLIIPGLHCGEKNHGSTETFLIIVEDVDGEVILSHDTYVLRQRYAEDERNVTLTIPIFDLIPPNSIISDRWLHSKTRPPIYSKHL
ncbi:hypothetical protein EDD85DRAFT_556667 [Armillaria nabsnona]|nr:hypothetical protein EDD85DRAFT_556667 [Armillaria nabsnona]